MATPSQKQLLRLFILKVQRGTHVFNFPQWRHVKRERIDKKFSFVNLSKKVALSC